MTAQVINREKFLAELVSQCRQMGKAKRETCAYGLKDLRDAAAEYVLSSAFPTTRDEEWRFTDLSPLLQFSFQVSDSNSASNIGLMDVTLPVKSKSQTLATLFWRTRRNKIVLATLVLKYSFFLYRWMKVC